MKCVRLRFLMPLACILVTVLFIWSNSMRNAAASTEQSNFFGEFFKSLFDIEREPFRFIYENRRKVAHFAEFALLGGEICLFLALNFPRRFAFYAFGGLCGVTVAVVDECIQLFSPGRAAALADVALDSAGVLTGMLATVGLVFLALYWHNRRRGDS